MSPTRELPLAGRRIVVTRAPGQGGELAAKLAALGAEPIELPAIEIRPAADEGPLDQAVGRLDDYDWLIFTSANGVRFFLQRLKARGGSPDGVRARVCAIGPATREALEAAGFRVDLTPEEYVAESLVAAFARQPLTGLRILLPRAAVARDVVPVELDRLGARVDVVEAYRTVIPEDGPRRAREVFGLVPKPDWITFTSSSTVVNFLAMAGRDALTGVLIASIGPVTSATLRGNGLDPAVEARPFTTDGLVAAILTHDSLRPHDLR